MLNSEIMSELDYRIEKFEENLSFIRGKSIFLYGIGANADAVIRSFDEEYHFQGVIAPAQTGVREKLTEFCGKPVFDLEDALDQRPEVILIAAQMYSAEEIYQRIHRICREHKVMLLDLYGFDQIRLHDELDSHSYLDLQGWDELTSGYDVVSFALLDIVIIRDVFGSRDGRMRPLFAHLFRRLAERGTKLVGIIEKDSFPFEWYDSALRAGGFTTEIFEKIYTREDTQRFFRDIKNTFPGKRMLHIGLWLLRDGIIPRLCGLDSYRMVYFDRSGLTAFEQTKKRGCPLDDSIKGEDQKTEWPVQNIRQMIAESDGVTCDVFDTLLIRRTLSPDDVFCLTAYTACEQGVLSAEEAGDFIRVRLEEQTRYITFDEIYAAAGQRLGLMEDTVSRLMQLEIETERRVLMPGRSAAEMIRYAADCGKKVVLVSDMYLPKEIIRSFLDENGIEGYDHIVVSGETGLSKQEGLFSVVKRECFKNKQRLVHLGDDPVADKLFSERAGYQPVIVPGVKLSTDVTDTAKNPAERLLAGVVKAQRRADAREESRESRLYDYGFCAIAPMIIGWTMWFIRQLQKDPVTDVLFAARDGYLFKYVYDRIRPAESPESVYYYTSRHAAFLPCADREDLFGYIEAVNASIGSESDIGRFYETDGLGQKEFPENREWLSAHIGQIRRSADAARKGQQLYRDRTGLKENSVCAFFDFVSSGTTQRMIEEIKLFHIKGYYVARNDNMVLTEHFKTYLTGDSPAEQNFLKRYMEMEYYLMPSEPSMRRYREDGSLEFADEVRTQEELEDIKTVHKGVMDCVDQYIDICPLTESLERGETISPECVCSLYLDGTPDLPARRYFDDWSMQWLNR